eukprot:3613379-Prymnesium_polylepis.1
MRAAVSHFRNATGGNTPPHQPSPMGNLPQAHAPHDAAAAATAPASPAPPVPVPVQPAAEQEDAAIHVELAPDDAPPPLPNVDNLGP